MTVPFARDLRSFCGACKTKGRNPNVLALKQTNGCQSHGSEIIEVSRQLRQQSPSCCNASKKSKARRKKTKKEKKRAINPFPADVGNKKRLGSAPAKKKKKKQGKKKEKENTLLTLSLPMSPITDV
jgi:hypothetical protein